MRILIRPKPNVAFQGRVCAIALMAAMGLGAHDGPAAVVPATLPGTLPCVRYVAIDPNHPGTVYATRYDPSSTTCPFPCATLFRSTDGGGTWVDVGASLPHQATLFGLAVDASSAVYTCSSADWSLYRSTDSGATWHVAGILYAIGMLADPTSPGTLYGWVGGIVKSMDGGATWLDATDGLGEPLPGETRPGIATVAIDPRDPSTLYAGRWEKGIYKSIDGGMHWQVLDMGVQPSGVVSIAVDPNNSSVVFAGTAEDGLFKSSDGGAHWRCVDTGQPNPQFFALAFDNDSTLYAGVYDHGVLVSPDGGATWTDAVPPLPSNYIVTLVADHFQAGRVYAGSLQ